MKESSTYQAILQEGIDEGQAKGQVQGALIEARRLLRLLGEDVYGRSDARITAAIERLDDLTRLEDLVKRVQNAGSWRELFRPRGGRRRQSP